MTDMSNASNHQPGDGILADIPRREFIEFSGGDASLSQMRFAVFKANYFRVLFSFVRWIQLLLYFYATTAINILLGRDSPDQRALRLRRAFERQGGSFVKLGIHLSVRLDFMPWAYCNELSCMTDRMRPFPVAQAVSVIERSLKKPLTAIFSRFDPDPILATSVACSYQAILLTGEKVIVKVRRPGIGEQFISDIRAFDWLLSLAELLTIFRPGITEEMRTEFRNLLLEELDFIQEARRQDAFRRAAAQSRQHFFSAPDIHLNLTTDEVMVNEFASGVWLWELLKAVEQGDLDFLKRVELLNIDPELVAQRLLWVNYWSWGENLFFHADPNPDNVIVGQDSSLYFINFTPTGTLNRSQRQAMRQNLKYALDRDPQNMARASLVLLEPLPPVDLIELVQELENYNWQLIYALEAAPQSLSWQERTSAIQWAGMMYFVRQHGVSVDIQVLRFIRATLLLESMAARLHKELDYLEEFRAYESHRAEQTRRRVTDAIMDYLDGDGSEQAVVRLDRMVNAAERLFFRTSHLLSLPSVNFNAMMSKWSFAVYILVRFLGQILFLSLIFALVLGLQIYLSPSGALNFVEVLQSVLLNPAYQVLVLLLVFINGRTVLYRMDDKEI